MSITVWRFSDGKPGHDAQSNGLLNALVQRRSVRAYEIPVAKYDRMNLRALLQRRFPPGADLPSPTLLLGAGHATHWPMLAARRACGGRIVVLMKPSLPRRWFDLCIIPQHDGVAADQGVLPSLGPLNTVVPSNCQQADCGLFLIGGPSRHYAWSDAEILTQIQHITSTSPQVRWLLTNSRRTPEMFSHALSELQIENLSFIPHSATPPGWVNRELARAAQVWVSADSMSMTFEALTAGAGVGLLPLPELRGSRLSRYPAQLAAEGYITGFNDWQPGQMLKPFAQGLNEAARCAAWIDQNWLCND